MTGAEVVGIIGVILIDHREVRVQGEGPGDALGARLHGGVEGDLEVD